MRKLLKQAALPILNVMPAPVLAAQEGGLHLRWRAGWIKAHWYKAKFKLCAALGGARFSAGRRLSIQGRLRVKGPGHVILGDDVIIDSCTDIYTHSAAATVTIGDRVFLNGTRFGCIESIAVGQESILADARIMDSDYHSLSKRRHSKEAHIGTAPIAIGKNVWIAGGSAVLKGVRIGDNSVVAFGSIVTKDIGEDAIAGGNPAREIAKVPE